MRDAIVFVLAFIGFCTVVTGLVAVLWWADEHDDKNNPL